MKKITLFILIFLCLNFSYSQEINAKVIVNSKFLNPALLSGFIDLEFSLSLSIINSRYAKVNYTKIDINIIKFFLLYYLKQNGEGFY